MVKTYDPKLVLVTIGGNPIQGYADGAFVSIVADEDAFTKVTGADGQTSRAKSNNTSARITITLKQTSPSNDVLNSIARADEIANAGVVPIQIKDLGGSTLFGAPDAWVAKKPDSEFSKEVGDRVWMIDTGSGNYEVGGN